MLGGLCLLNEVGVEIFGELRCFCLPSCPACGSAGDSVFAGNQYQGEALLMWQFDILAALPIIFQTVYPVRRSVVLGDMPVIERRNRIMTQAYCVKCRKKVEIKNPKQVTLI